MCVAAAVDEFSPTRLEKHLNNLLGDEFKDATGVWRSYCEGSSKPFKKRAVKPKAAWVDEVERLYPGTSRWFYTPVWYLLEETEFYPSEIYECAKQLPHDELAEHLLSGEKLQESAALMLSELTMQVPWLLAVKPSPEALGAMACAMRRAELAGQMPIFRRAGIGMLWLLDRLIPKEPLLVRECLRELRRIVKKKFDKQVYPMGSLMRSPPKRRDLEEFSKRVTLLKSAEKAFDKCDMEKGESLIDQALSMK